MREITSTSDTEGKDKTRQIYSTANLICKTKKKKKKGKTDKGIVFANFGVICGELNSESG